MSGSHTPGPWFIEDDRSDDEIAIVGHPTWSCRRFGVDGQWDVCKVEGDTDDTLANARLISAAPDLLDALRNFTDGRDISYVDALEAARAAIAKAAAA